MAVKNLKTICFEIEGYLCSRSTPDRYEFAPANEDNIKILCHLHKAGHTIILSSSRESAYRKDTLAWLKRNKVPYHKLVMDCISADIYVNQRALCWSCVEDKLSVTFEVKCAL